MAPSPDSNNDTPSPLAMVMIRGHSFRCGCGCNVFQQLPRDTFECNACGEWYRGVTRG